MDLSKMTNSLAILAHQDGTVVMVNLTILLNPLGISEMKTDSQAAGLVKQRTG
jgi:hypothetical protein